MKLGIIGYGRIGQMISENLLKLNLINPDELIISNRNIKKLNKIKKDFPQITITDNNKELAQSADKIIISVESDDLLDVLREIKDDIDNTHIIQTCAGISFDDIKEVFDGPVTVIIPSLASRFQQRDNPQKGISLIVHNDKVNFLNSTSIETLFNEFTYVKILPSEKDIEIATILTSCAPAFISLIVKKLAEYTVENSSLDYSESKYLILKTLIGTSENLSVDTLNNESCDAMIDSVCTPGGITEKGVEYLDTSLEEEINQLFNILFKTYDKSN